MSTPEARLANTTPSRSDTNDREQQPFLEARGLSKRYSTDLRRSIRYGAGDILSEFGHRRRDAEPDVLRSTEFWAVNDVSLSMRPGDALGIIGRNGSGKSTLLRMLAGITRPDRGEVIVREHLGTLLDAEASLSPLLTGRENIEVGLAMGGARDPSDADRIGRVIDFSGIRPFIDDPVRSYSSGMRLRLGFAVMINLQPRILLIDEALVVGDTAFQRRCLIQLRRFLAGGGALAFVTHSVSLFRVLATTALYMNRGSIVVAGEPGPVATQYLRDLIALEGGVAGADDPLAREGGAQIDSPVHSTEEHQEEGEPEVDEEEDHPEPRADVPPATGPKASAQTASASALSPTLRPISATSIQVRHEDGGRPISGEPALVEIEIAASEPMAAALWGITLWTPDLLVSPLMTVNGRDALLTVPPGSSRLVARVQQLTLAPGQYALRSAVFDAATMDILMMFGYESDPHFFEVGAGQSPPVEPKIGGEPLTVLRASWSVSRPQNSESS